MRIRFDTRLLWSLVVALGFAGWLVAVPVAAETYHFAGGHSTVTIGWSHAGLSHHTARLVGFAGQLDFDPASPETGRVDVRLDPTELSSGVTALDRLLRSPDFFDVVNYPMITFKSTQAIVTGERTGQVVGDLTIRGTTRSVTLDVTWNFTGEHPLGLVNPSFAGKFVSGFSATTKLLRSEWGLGRGAPLISDEVDVAIEVEAVRR
ncbi:MAG: YceI family protein [Hyphomicrobiaceae bacterium]